MIFKTEHLILRPWEEGDAESLFLFASNPKIGPIAGWPPHESVEDSLNIIKRYLLKGNICSCKRQYSNWLCWFAVPS